MARDERDVASGTIEGVGEERHERIVGSAVNGRGRQAYEQRVAADSGNCSPSRARDDAYRQGDPRGAWRQWDGHESRIPNP